MNTMYQKRLNALNAHGLQKMSKTQKTLKQSFATGFFIVLVVFLAVVASSWLYGLMTGEIRFEVLGFLTFFLVVLTVGYLWVKRRAKWMPKSVKA